LSKPVTSRGRWLRSSTSAVVSSAFFAGAVRSADAQTGPKLRVAAVANDVGVGSAYAYDQGFFKEHGLDVELIAGGSGASIAAAVAGGAMDVGSGNTASIATAHENGIPFVLIAPSGAWNSKTPTGALLVSRASPIASPTDLAGKVIGVTIVRGISEVAVRSLIDKSGGHSDTAKFIELPYSAMGAALAGGRVDAVSVEEPAFSSIMSSGDVRSIGAPNGAIASSWIEGGYFVTLAFARAHPDIVRRFGDAMAETAIWANKNPSLSAKILAKYANSPVGSASTVRVFYPERLHVDDIQPLIDASAKYGILKASFPARDLIAPGVPVV
jgi:NitT/TauT family transport system substrate-binding protein